MEKITTNLQKILVTRHFLQAGIIEKGDNTSAYLNAFLLANFGIVVDKPQLLTKSMVEYIQELYKLNVPEGFYKNPQDTKYYSRDELLIEQLVSYFLVETGTGIYDRVEIFEKDLPEYKVGDEIKLREFKILSNAEADAVLSDIAKAYCDYTRPFSLEELEEFKVLFEHGYVPSTAEISCKDNIFTLLPYDIKFAAFLDKKDIVKLSVKLVGEKKTNIESFLEKADTDHLIKRALPLVRNCPMTKKQAKYYNKLVSVYHKGTAVEANSPHKKAMALFKEGKTVEAARVYAKNGSLLERNLRMLLSRANPKEAMEIIDMIKAKNPIVLYQLIQSLEEEAGKSRTFTFTKNHLVKHHVETDYETKWRKSRLSSGTIKFLHEACVQKIYDYYSSLESLGKVYISDTFYKLGLPANTSASNKGIDVLPTGSRLPIRGTAIRTFVTWKGPRDIDSSLTFIKDDGSTDRDYMYFGNYSQKRFGNDILFSGDDRSANGTEYYDIKIDAMRSRGYKYIIQSFHGYDSRLDIGEIYAGYQNKDNLETKAWDPKNIEMQFRVKGDTRACQSFAIDLETKEIVILNLMVQDEHRVGLVGGDDPIAKYLKDNFLEINMGGIIEHRGVKVDSPTEADIVFDDSYNPETAPDGSTVQKLVRSWELEKLVSIANGK